MFLIEAVANAPNPLSNSYNNALKECRLMRTSVETSIAKLAALIGKKDMDHYHTFSNDQASDLLCKLIDSVRDIHDKDKENVIRQAELIENAHSDAIQLIGSVSSLRGKKLEDFSSLTLQESMEKLSNEIENTLTFIQNS